MQPLQQEHLARLSLVHCRLRKSSRIVQCLSHSTGLSPCQHLSPYAGGVGGASYGGLVGGYGGDLIR